MPHRGIDIAAATGTPVYAAFAGTVERAFKGSWVGDKRYHFPLRTGNHVFVRNPDGEAQYYGHLSAVYVTAGQRVTKGQLIGRVGGTGNVTGPHLHFEAHSPTSRGTNSYTRTFEPRILFKKYGVTPGQNPGTVTPQSAPPQRAKGKITVSEANRIIKELKTRASAAQVKAVYERQSAYKRDQDAKHAALEKRVAALEKQVGTRASSNQVKAVYERQSAYQAQLRQLIAAVSQAVKDKLNITINLKDK